MVWREIQIWREIPIWRAPVVDLARAWVGDTDSRTNILPDPDLMRLRSIQVLFLLEFADAEIVRAVNRAKTTAQRPP